MLSAPPEMSTPWPNRNGLLQGVIEKTQVLLAATEEQRNVVES